MAGVSTKEIKTRIRSMESTKQITKAMEMVAASKLRHAQARVLNSRPYFKILSSAMADIVGANTDFSSGYFAHRPVKKTACVVIAGDRGLAGGYNSNVLKLAQAQLSGKEAVVIPVGKKAADFFKSRGIPALTQKYAEAADVSVGDCFTIAKQLSKAYLAGEIDEVSVCYTNFVSVLSQTPEIRTILPLTQMDEPSNSAAADILYEPNSVEVFDAIVPEYLGGVLYGALCESRAAEQAARRTAMESATKNAEEMIADLSLKYNQARQAAITQEITEIVGGA